MYIKSFKELARHPKTRKTARALGIGIPQMIGHLHLLWYWADDYAQDGDLSRYEHEDVVEATMWEGDKDIVEALVCGGWLDRDGDEGLHIHDWQDHAGALIEAREKNRLKQQRYRERHANPPEELANGYVTDTLPLRNRAKEEKKREEENKEEKNTGGLAPPAPPRVRARAGITIPPDFHLSYEMVEWGIHEKYDLVLDLDKETAEFIDYWTIGEGQGKRKKNWELTWKARIRERAERVSKIRPFVQKAGNGTKASINDPEVRAKLLPGGKYSFLFDKGEKT